jgi:hypothetical protein
LKEKDVYVEFVKSVSVARSPPSDAFSQVHAAVMAVSVIVPHQRKASGWNLLAGRAPQEHKSPDGVVFSVADLSQVQLPAGRAPDNQLV